MTSNTQMPNADAGRLDRGVMQHTPGPWRFYTEPQPNGCPIVGARGLMVCMLAHTVRQPEQRSEALANAALIAAAPDLLESLQYAVAQVPELATVPGISAAITKAVGRDV